MEKVYTVFTDEEKEFIKNYQVVIDMCKRQARSETQKYEENARRMAQSKLGKINFQDNISRKDLQSVSGTLNIDSENYYKKCLKILLQQHIPNIPEKYIDDILFTA